MADKRDYYEVLGVEKGVSDDELKKAYRKAAKQYHPDLHPGDAEAEKCFKEVNEAYEVLSDKEKRARYDQFGHAGVDPNFGAGGGGYGGGFGGFGDFGDLGDIFGEFFGGSSRRASANNAPRRGENVGVRLDLTFEEAAFGCEKEVSAQRIENCASCGGSGEGTCAEFVEAVTPQYALLTGEEPANAVKVRLERVGAKVYTAKENGVMTVYSDGQQIAVKP